jgi:transcriptional regulator with XRE-family HTH domain
MCNWEKIYGMIASNIRDKRKQLHISQSQLAEKAEVSLDTIKSVEHGRRTMSLDTYLKIAHALHTTPQALMNWEAFNQYYDRFAFMMNCRDEKEIEFVLHMVEQMLGEQDCYMTGS